MPGSATSAIHPIPTACRSGPTTRNGRSPMRSTSAPATGATKNSVAVQGRSRSPASSGPEPSPVCMNCARKKTPQNSEPTAKKMAAFPAENARERKNRIGSIGSRARSCQATKAARSSTPAASAATTSRLPQPAMLPRTRPHTRPKTPPVTSASPRRSRAESGPKLSRSRPSASGTSAIPIGTFSQKIHCQASPSAIAPPTSGPLATARPVTAKKIPSAEPRRSGGNAALTSAKASVMTSAAPPPWTARAAIRAPIVGASAQAAEASANSPRPAANMRRRPKRSPSAAAVISRTAKLRL